MIVASYFDGDEDMKIAWIQHDVYGSALDLIVTNCNKITRIAQAILDDQVNNKFGTVPIYKVDHRTLQFAYDLLAAAWRSKNDFLQQEFSFGKDRSFVAAKNEWLSWLAMEVEGWLLRPHLVRNVQLIICNQNQPLGYLAESQLCLDIINYLNDVPWRKGLRDAFRKDIESVELKLRSLNSGIQLTSCPHSAEMQTLIRL